MDDKLLRGFCFALIFCVWAGIAGIILSGCSFELTPEQKQAQADACQRTRLLTIQAFPDEKLYPDTKFEVAECGVRLSMKTPPFADAPSCRGFVIRAAKRFSDVGLTHWDFPTCYSWRTIKGVTGKDMVQLIEHARYNDTTDSVDIGYTL